jgi:hypothetical protein
VPLRRSYLKNELILAIRNFCVSARQQAQFSITVSFFYNRDDSQISVLLNFYLPLRTTGMDKLRRHLNGQCGMGGMEQLEEQGSIMADKALSPPALLHGIRA